MNTPLVPNAIKFVNQSNIASFLKSKPLIILQVLAGGQGDFNRDVIEHFTKDHGNQVMFGCFDVSQVLAFADWAPKYFGQLADRGCGYYLFREGQTIAYHPNNLLGTDDTTGALVLGAVLLSLILWNPTPLVVTGAAVQTASQRRDAVSIIGFFEKAMAQYPPLFPTANADSRIAAVKISPFETLGVLPNASDEEIKAAYRKQLGLNHPDKAAHLSKEIQTLAEQRTRAIVGAYADIAKRRKL